MPWHFIMTTIYEITWHSNTCKLQGTPLWQLLMKHYGTPTVENYMALHITLIHGELTYCIYVTSLLTLYGI